MKDNKAWLGIALILLAIIGAFSVVLLSGSHNPTKAANRTSPVPKSVSQAVNFPVYYPDQKKLPAGYFLDTNSFKTPVKNGVLYAVNYENGKKIVFSVQAKPTDSELESFKANYIPLRTDYQTSLGQAEIGAYNNHGNAQTLVSLPTNTNAWIIITAPYDINQDQLKQVVRSLQD